MWPHVTRHRLLRQHFFTSGEHFWEVAIVSCSSGASALVVGAAASEDFECETLQDAHAPWRASGGIGYAASGAVLKGGREVGRFEPFGEGDTVGVLLDMNERCVSFFLNGAPQCARGDPREHEPDESKSDDAASRRTRLRVRFEHRALFPAITQGLGRDEVDVSMRLLVPAE